MKHLAVVGGNYWRSLGVNSAIPRKFVAVSFHTSMDSEFFLFEFEIKLHLNSEHVNIRLSLFTLCVCVYVW
jgi:hypothetical protein